ncbi:hypothetical protein ColTof3_14178 [Colletotrichum tofieldiae]|nr:hypothetical protein ColTof3_14178 [Colletotrichum tofieldiae]GKT94905.1 hypothetical protein Ct61P_12755 [Colletotrichum tofieldiae]
MDQVVVVNATHRTLLQEGWRNWPYSCGRPAPDLDIPIICTVGSNFAAKPSNNRGYLENAGRDFETFRHCCPFINNRTNVYTTQDECQMSFCFTHQPGIVINWNKCVKDAAGKRMGELQAEGKNFNFSRDAFRGQCEWIDYEAIRNALLYNHSQNDSGSASFETGKLLVVTGALATVLAACLILY